MPLSRFSRLVDKEVACLREIEQHPYLKPRVLLLKIPDGFTPLYLNAPS